MVSRWIQIRISGLADIFLDTKNEKASVPNPQVYAEPEDETSRPNDRAARPSQRSGPGLIDQPTTLYPFFERLFYDIEFSRIDRSQTFFGNRLIVSQNKYGKILLVARKQ